MHACHTRGCRAPRDFFLSKGSVPLRMCMSVAKSSLSIGDTSVHAFAQSSVSIKEASEGMEKCAFCKSYGCACVRPYFCSLVVAQCLGLETSFFAHVFVSVCSSRHIFSEVHVSVGQEAHNYAEKTSVSFFGSIFFTLRRTTLRKLKLSR